MGTNYYRVPKIAEINSKYQKLHLRLQEMNIWDPSLIERNYSFINNPEDEWSVLNPWDEFVKDINIHLGKRSGGWKFCWNFHNGKYYKTKDELLDFIRKGRVVNEYGEEIDVEEFIEMSLNWSQPDGLTVNREYLENNLKNNFYNYEQHYDKEIDGLRVSSATEFC
jgi:hypothetical protein